MFWPVHVEVSREDFAGNVQEGVHILYTTFGYHAPTILYEMNPAFHFTSQATFLTAKK